MIATILVLIVKYATHTSKLSISIEHTFMYLNPYTSTLYPHTSNLYPGFTEPTPVQKTVIPRLLNNENLVMAASTGSGKTLAFTLPILQTLISQEELVNFT